MPVGDKQKITKFLVFRTVNFENAIKAAAGCVSKNKCVEILNEIYFIGNHFCKLSTEVTYFR